MCDDLWSKGYHKVTIILDNNSTHKDNWIKNIGCAEDSPTPDPIINNNKKVHFGVFTCKGGVGKTTVSAHLAGAFLLQDFNVALIDLDPEQNLNKLVGE